MAGEEGVTLLATLIAFGVISISFYLLVLRPILPTDPERPAVEGAVNNNNNNNRNNNLNRAAGGARRPGGQPADAGAQTQNGTSNATNSESGNIERILADCVSYPSHAAPNSQSCSRVGGSNMLIDGLLAFRHTRAATYEQSKTTTEGDIVTQNRKDRARVLSRMLSLEAGAGAVTTTPPQRGSTVVISIPSAEVGCPKLRRVLFLVGTHYNLLVILVFPEDAKGNEMGEFIKKLRGSGDDLLDEEVLPDHRIVASTTAAGRIAFVRQLSRAEIILDFDSDVKTQLKRFGFRVFNYNKTSHSTNGTSQLGSQMLL